MKYTNSIIFGCYCTIDRKNNIPRELKCFTECEIDLMLEYEKKIEYRKYRTWFCLSYEKKIVHCKNCLRHSKSKHKIEKDLIFKDALIKFNFY